MTAVSFVNKLEDRRGIGKCKNEPSALAQMRHGTDGFDDCMNNPVLKRFIS